MTDISQTSREDKAETLWVTDAELIRRSGIPEKIARNALKMLDRDRYSGFPAKQKMWGDRRYWPAVKAYFERVGTGKLGVPENQQRRAS
jgi:hypothetical protein